MTGQLGTMDSARGTPAGRAEAAVVTTGLVKRFGSLRALDGLDLTVGRGQVHGFLGPNGAGKSTTLRILLGLARADGGAATVLGGDPFRDAVRLHRVMAYVPGDVDVWPTLSAGEVIDLLTRLRGADPRTGSVRAERSRLVEAFELDVRTKGRALFKGNRQKVALVAAFSVPALLYVLDEPTSGLGPLMELVFQREIERVRDAGSTVLLSSHLLSEVERLCDHVSIIRAGRIVDSGTLAQLRQLTRTEISFDGDAPVAVPGAHGLSVRDSRVRLSVDSAQVPAVLPRLAELSVRGLRVEPPSLEELFLRHYGRE